MPLFIQHARVFTSGRADKEKMHHKTLKLSKKDVPRSVSSVRKILPALRPSSCYTSIWRYQARSDGSRSCSMRKSDGPSSPENRMSCSRTGWGHQPPQEQDLSAIMEIVEDEKETEEEVEFVGDTSPDASSMNAHDYARASPSASELVYANVASNDGQDSGRERLIATLGENRMYCSPTGWGHQPPQEQDLSATMEIVEDERETEEVEFVGDKSPDASSMNAHDYARASPSTSEPVYANFASADRQDSVRDRVIATLGLYRNMYRELSDEKSRGSIDIRRIDLVAAREVKKRGGYVHGANQFIGDVPGVEFGDKFYLRAELAIVGLHRPLQNGIDYIGPHPNILATSVVASWDYADDLRNQDELVYLGEGGMGRRGKKAEDQKLTRGNLALANSMKRNKPVRVIRKEWDHTFRYDGLYTVDRWQKIYRASGKTAFEFIMKRLSSHPETL